MEHLDRPALRNGHAVWKLSQEAVRVIVKVVLDHAEIKLGLALLPHAQRLALHDVTEHEQLVTRERFPLGATALERCLGERTHDDAAILAEAYRQGRTLVTRDVRTIPPLLVLLAQAGTSHGGVIFVDHRAIPEGNTGALVRSLLALWQEEGETDWTDRVAYLRPRDPAGEKHVGEGEGLDEL